MLLRYRFGVAPRTVFLTSLRHCHTYDHNHHHQFLHHHSSATTASQFSYINNNQHDLLFQKAETELQTPIIRALRKMTSSRTAIIDTIHHKFRGQQEVHIGQQQQQKISLVTSAVLATPSSCDCGKICTCPPILKMTGVNSALHRQIHHRHDGNTNSSSSSSTIMMKGLLKGCAEQNALGSFAASGQHFEQIRGIVICSLHLNYSSGSGSNNNTSSSSSEEGNYSNRNAIRNVTEGTCCFPCTACRNYLSKVQRFVTLRHPQQSLKLSCVSLKLEEEEDVEAEQKSVSMSSSSSSSTSSAEMNNTTSTSTKKKMVSLECVNGWDTSYKEVKLILGQ